MFPYDPNEVVAGAKDVVRKMTGRDVHQMLAVLAYVDDHGESGSKILLEGRAEVRDAVGGFVDLYVAALVNISHSIRDMRDNIRRHLGEEEAAAFEDQIWREAQERFEDKGRSGTLRNLFQIKGLDEQRGE